MIHKVQARIYPLARQLKVTDERVYRDLMIEIVREIPMDELDRVFNRIPIKHLPQGEELFEVRLVTPND